MPQSFHLFVDATDCLGKHPRIEMTVIAADEQEAREEVAEYFSMHEEIDSWKISEIRDVSSVSEESPHARDYSQKGAHSYISWGAYS